MLKLMITYNLYNSISQKCCHTSVKNFYKTKIRTIYKLNNKLIKLAICKLLKGFKPFMK